MATISIALAALVVGYFVGHRAGVKSGRFDAQFRNMRAEGQFQACDMELNALKIKHSQTLMQLEDARK